MEERGWCCSRRAAERAEAERGAARGDTEVIGVKVLNGGATDGSMRGTEELGGVGTAV